MSFFPVLLLVSILTITKRGKKMYKLIDIFKISLINKLLDEIDKLQELKLSKDELKFTNELIQLLRSKYEG